MEFEGFGVSLVGRALYIHGQWIPWEFISGVAYSSKILVTGEEITAVEAENTWNYIVRPASGKDWSILATILRGIGGTVLLTFNSSISPPASFYAYLDGLLLEGKIVVTRIWIGAAPHCIPDAAFFQSSSNGDEIASAYEFINTLPARNGHGHASIAKDDLASSMRAAADAGLGIVVSDLGEKSWSLFWHKQSDSAPANQSVLLRRGLRYIRLGAAMVDSHN